MQFIYTLSLAAAAIAAYVPSEPWSTLTPSAAAPSGATTDYTKTFGIAVIPISTASSATSSLAKRDVVTQIGDGQIQATTTTESTSTKAQVVTQIGDGQIQATTATTQAQVVTQIGDGQIQATTKTTLAPVVTQIGDGQIQATTKTTQVVSQIGDGQIQATTETKSATAATQINDGQIQATTETSKPTSTSATSDPTSPVKVESCLTSSSLAMTLKHGVLTDSKGRIGSIVANRQFQFDGPPPQAGAIYAGGWSITEDGYLAIGNETTFYQCLSGSFYNLYDRSIGGQCHPIHLEVVDLVKC